MAAQPHTSYDPLVYAWTIPLYTTTNTWIGDMYGTTTTSIGTFYDYSYVCQSGYTTQQVDPGEVLEYEGLYCQVGYSMVDRLDCCNSAYSCTYASGTEYPDPLYTTLTTDHGTPTYALVQFNGSLATVTSNPTNTAATATSTTGKTSSVRKNACFSVWKMIFGVMAVVSVLQV